MVILAELSALAVPALVPILYETVKGKTLTPSGALAKIVIGIETWLEPPALIEGRLKIAVLANMYGEDFTISCGLPAKSVPVLLIVKSKVPLVPGSSVAGFVEEVKDKDTKAFAEDTKNSNENAVNTINFISFLIIHLLFSHQIFLQSVLSLVRFLHRA
jgi:hypothetical protein